MSFYTDDGYLMAQSKFKVGDRVILSSPMGREKGFIIDAIKVKNCVGYSFYYTVTKGTCKYIDIDELYLGMED